MVSIYNLHGCTNKNKFKNVQERFVLQVDNKTCLKINLSHRSNLMTWLTKTECS